LMLTLGKLWRSRAQRISWIFIPAAGLVAYGVTLVANTIRISTSLQLRGMSSRLMTPEQLHRFEGIFIYFGFLLLLFIFSERLMAMHAPAAETAASLWRKSLFPLLVYYATTLGLPLANGAYRDAAFWEHSVYVLLVPLLFVLPIKFLARGVKRSDPLRKITQQR